jgi:DNA-binding response OmpR family regulator
MKILIVDDDEHILRLYREELEEEGYEVATAQTGAKGLELFERENPDLVTLDILIPDVDGITLLRRMKEMRPRVPIIMSTAYDYRDDFAVWASEAYIVKSADLSELKNMIRKLLGEKAEKEKE